MIKVHLCGDWISIISAYVGWGGREIFSIPAMAHIYFLFLLDEIF
jgi:hypothetical protein